MKDIVKIGSELIENNRNKSTKSKDDFFKKLYKIVKTLFN